MNLLQIVQIMINLILAGCTAYLLLLTWAAWKAPNKAPGENQTGGTRFLVLIPAHNEERLLPGCIDSLHDQDYPHDLYSVHVIADNCSDRTFEVARHGKAVPHWRENTHLRGKGHALRWAMEELKDEIEQADAIVILDADTLVSSNFLSAMAGALARGGRVLQGYYAVRDPQRSWAGRLRYIAFAAVHYLRPLGRKFLGASAGLKGNGMVFHKDVLRRCSWPVSLTEDIEMHTNLIAAGERVEFVPQAAAYGEMPVSLRQSQSQHDRWERGRLSIARSYIPTLLRMAWHAARAGNWRRAFILFDAAIELFIPPFTVLVGVTGASLAAGFLLFRSGLPLSPGFLAGVNLWLPLGLLLGQGIYFFYSLLLVGAPANYFLIIFYFPIFFVWKTGQYIGAALHQNQQGWVRTTRNEG